MTLHRADDGAAEIAAGLEVPSKQSLRRIAYVNLAPEGWTGTGLSPLNRILAVLILLSIGVAVLETEDSIRIPHAALFDGLDAFFALVFTAEYGLRLWVVGEDPKYRGVLGRLRYMVTPRALIDLLAVAPFYLGAGGDGYLLRIIRLLRILSLARLGGLSTALVELRAAVVRRRHDFVLSLCITGAVLLISASVMYVVEGPVQPQAFGSIPRSLWWAIATLTTVGYGDVYPVTVLGRFFAGLSAVAGIGLIALPTGILAAAFSEACKKDDD